MRGTVNFDYILGQNHLASVCFFFLLYPLKRDYDCREYFATSRSDRHCGSSSFDKGALVRLPAPAQRPPLVPGSASYYALSAWKVRSLDKPAGK